MLCLQAFAVSIPWWDWLFGVGLSVGVLLLVVGVIACWLLNFLGLPGNWLLLCTTFVYAMVIPWDGDRRLAVCWTVVAVLAAMAILGEALEFAAGIWGASRAGGRRKGATLAFIGSLAGGILGVAVGLPIPVVGSVIAALLFAALGALLGGIVGERWHGQNWTDSLKVGHAAFWGRLTGTLGKVLVGFVMVILVLCSLCLMPV